LALQEIAQAILYIVAGHGLQAYQKACCDDGDGDGDDDDDSADVLT